MGAGASAAQGESGAYAHAPLDLSEESFISVLDVHRILDQPTDLKADGAAKAFSPSGPEFELLLYLIFPRITFPRPAGGVSGEDAADALDTLRACSALLRDARLTVPQAASVAACVGSEGRLDLLEMLLGKVEFCDRFDFVWTASAVCEPSLAPDERRELYRLACAPAAAGDVALYDAADAAHDAAAVAEYAAAAFEAYDAAAAAAAVRRTRRLLACKLPPASLAAVAAALGIHAHGACSARRRRDDASESPRLCRCCRCFVASAALQAAKALQGIYAPEDTHAFCKPDARQVWASIRSVAKGSQQTTDCDAAEATRAPQRISLIIH
ncbi:hypothetical protein M885DRAFT_513239 [Pelagophyceae sp. CCMP2097]|nr:hypothetical protein M885DRAFT_513239 [Pelagophyceae sp. CCMP2097]